MVPALTLVTVPDVPTVAIPVLVLLQVPPGVASEREVVAPPSQTVLVPDMEGGVVGIAFTVIIIVAAVMPQPFVTV